MRSTQNSGADLPRISVVIRAWNEAGPLERLLDQLHAQRYPAELVEVLVVDNGSTDNTAKLCADRKVGRVFLPQSEFSYPKSLNAGIAASTGGVIVLISAHGLPMNQEWLAIAGRYFGSERDPKLAGIYGKNAPGRPSSVWEKALMWPDYWQNVLIGPQRINKPVAGMFNATNCAFPRDLWEQHRFDETWEAGGEDYEWGAWALEQGYYLMLEPAFTVFHSHCLGFRRMLQQLKYWKSLRAGRPFRHDDLSYRTDLAQRIRDIKP